MRTIRRFSGLLAAAALAAVPVALVTVTTAQAATASVANGAQLRAAWADHTTTTITLTANITLGDSSGGSSNDCTHGEPVRPSDGVDVVVDGQGQFGITQTCEFQRVLRNRSAASTTLQGLTHFTGGDASGNGGGLRSAGAVTVTNSNVSDNTALNCLTLDSSGAHASDVDAQCTDGDGGGIYATGSATVTNSTISGNTAGDDGGGIYVASGQLETVDVSGTLTITGSTISNNVAQGTQEGGGRGGGTYSDGNLTVSGSTVSGNHAGTLCTEGCVGSGGGSHTYGNATLTNSTYSDNEAHCGSANPGNSQGYCEGPGAAGGGVAAVGGMNVGAADVQGQVTVTPSTVTSTDTNFTGNTTTCNGDVGGCGPEGGAEVAGGGFFAAGDAAVTGGTFSGNTAGSGCTACEGSGGGFFSGGTATVTGATFGNNIAQCFVSCDGSGGGFEASSFTLGSSSLTGNEAVCAWSGLESRDCGGVGGAISVGDNDGDETASGDSTVTQTTFSGNSATYDGGAIWTGGPTLTASASTFAGNQAKGEAGGAIAFWAGCCGQTAQQSDFAFTLTNSTVTGNSQVFAGALDLEGPDVTLRHDTIDANSVVAAPPVTCDSVSLCSQSHGQSRFHATDHQIHAQGAAPPANLFVSDGSATFFGIDVTHPSGGANCVLDTTVQSTGYDYADDTSCALTATTDSAATSNDPLLNALGDNGGPTQTMLPKTPLKGGATSPLIDAIPVASCAPTVTVDQRGITRPQNVTPEGGCDIGAVEVQGIEFMVSPVVVIQPKFTG